MSVHPLTYFSTVTDLIFMCTCIYKDVSHPVLPCRGLCLNYGENPVGSLKLFYFILASLCKRGAILDLPCPSVIQSFCDSVTISGENVRHTFLRNCEAYKDLVHTWTVDGCIVYTRIRLPLLISPFIHCLPTLGLGDILFLPRLSVHPSIRLSVSYM